MINKYYNLAKKKLFTINRSITGRGIRKTLQILKENEKNIKIKSFKSGTKVFDWNIPPEWNVTKAYVLDKNNNKIIDFEKNNLHLVSYSAPINKFIDKKTLLKHLHTSKKLKNAIPYVTSYYKKYWGFCCTENKKKEIKKFYKNSDKFKVYINSSFKKKGKLVYGECTLKGRSSQEIIISTYVCHPSMANNELSGPIVSMSLINYFKGINLKKTLKFLFIPETIGSISYLYKNLQNLKKKCIGGYLLTCIGDEGKHSCMLSRNSNSISDKSLINAYKKLNIKYKIYSYLERGSDERQYNYPGIDLGFSSIFKSKYGKYKQYHTSLDDFKFVTLKGVTSGFKVAKTAINILQNQIVPKNKYQCEPKLSKHKLYKDISAHSGFTKKDFSRKILDFLNYCDGTNSIEDIAKITKLSNREAILIFQLLKKKKLIKY